MALRRLLKRIGVAAAVALGLGGLYLGVGYIALSAGHPGFDQLLSDGERVVDKVMRDPGVRSAIATGGKRFTAPAPPVDASTKHQPRWEFLLRWEGPHQSTNIPFFAVWMSRDIVYLAPVDTQRAIIEQWQRWWETNGVLFDYRPAKSIDDWYF